MRENRMHEEKMRSRMKIRGKIIKTSKNEKENKQKRKRINERERRGK